jgi:undecaprenyl-diphosphatase
LILGTNPFDTAVRAWTLAHQTPAMLRAAALVSKIGAVSVLCWLSVAAALYCGAHRRRGAAVSLLLAPLLAVAVYESGKRSFLRARPPSVDGIVGAANSFPSAHSTASAAVCCTLAYVLWRERQSRGPTALALATVPPLLIGASRVYLNVHWATDVIGGWVAGLGIGMLAAVVYNRVPRS